jgi:Na+/citrate or Na+/malate symporter
LRGIVKIFVPLLAGSVMALLIGSVTGMAVGMPLSKAIPMIVIPVMAGGVGEGAIPLSLGYGEIFRQSSADILSHLLPVVLFANLVAIILAGCLNAFGRRYPRFTGNGELEMDSVKILQQPASMKVAPVPLTIDRLLAAVLFGISLYLLGILSHQLLAIPAPVTMLVLAVLLKVSNLLPSWLDISSAFRRSDCHDAMGLGQRGAPPGQPHSDHPGRVDPDGHGLLCGPMGAPVPY